MTEPPSPESTPPRIQLGVGAVYIETATGREFVLAALRSRKRVCMIHDRSGTERCVLDYLEVQELADRFTFDRCNHEDYCCSRHRIHVQPHLGCLFR